MVYKFLKNRIHKTLPMKEDLSNKTTLKLKNFQYNKGYL